ncbi:MULTISPECIES: hypothetical protein [unclassified Microcoleus]|uniref:hypothetical protein n=1 Tax=unclassified Microcoleus TaxID=2642155 RepID=UPI002FD0855F
MAKRVGTMSYEQLQAERDANELLKTNLKAQIEQVTDSQLCLHLQQELLHISKRNEKLAGQQVLLMKGGKPKRPIDMSLEEIEAELEKNKNTVAQFEQQLTSSNFDTRFNASQELRTLYTRDRALSKQRVALLNHSIAILKEQLNATQKR